MCLPDAHSWGCRLSPPIWACLHLAHAYFRSVKACEGIQVSYFPKPYCQARYHTGFLFRNHFYLLGRTSFLPGHETYPLPSMPARSQVLTLLSFPTCPQAPLHTLWLTGLWSPRMASHFQNLREAHVSGALGPLNIPVSHLIY